MGDREKFEGSITSSGFHVLEDQALVLTCRQNQSQFSLALMHLNVELLA